MERQALIDQLSNRADNSQQDLPSPKARYPMINDIYLKKPARDSPTHSRSPSPTAPGPQPSVNTQVQQPNPHRPQLADLVNGIHGIQKAQRVGLQTKERGFAEHVNHTGQSGDEDRISVIIKENDALLAQNARLASDLAHLESEKEHCNLVL
jgi:hypothetical protein